MQRRTFLSHSAAALAASWLPQCVSETLAAEPASSDRRIASIDFIRASGKLERLEGVNRQHQVQPGHLYRPPRPYRDATEPRAVVGTAAHYFLRVRTHGGAEGLYGAVDADVVPMVLGRLRGVVMGQDALAVESLWDQMYRSDRMARGGLYMKGISAIDNALWDLRGRYFGVPVYRLLGGPTRDEARAYASCLGFSVVPEEAARRAQALKQQGFEHQKWFLAYGPAGGGDGQRANVALVAALREAVGEATELFFDAFQGWTLPYALSWTAQVERYRPGWIEEAFPLADFASFERLSQRTSIPLATGEHFFNRWEVEPFLKSGLLAYVQADPEWCGGTSELVKICHLASVAGVQVVPHGHNIHAALHVVLSQSPAVCPLVEYLFNHMPTKTHLQRDPPLTTNGIIGLPVRPGFGIEIDEQAADDIEVISEAS